MESATFIQVTPQLNVTEVTEGPLPIATSLVVAAIHCVLTCLYYNNCFKALLANDHCSCYEFIGDSKLPITPEAVIVKRESVYHEEKYFWEVSLHLDRKNRAEAQAACEAEGGTLAMPKGDYQFKFLAFLANAKRSKGVGDFIWIGVDEVDPRAAHQDFRFLDGDKPGDNGYHFPIEPAVLNGAADKGVTVGGLLFFYNNDWLVGDLPTLTPLPFFCQSG